MRGGRFVVVGACFAIGRLSYFCLFQSGAQNFSRSSRDRKSVHQFQRHAQFSAGLLQFLNITD